MRSLFDTHPDAALPPQRDTADSPALSRESVDGDSLASSLTWFLCLTMGSKILGLVRSILVCRWLDPASTGLWGMGQAFMDMAVPLFLLSIPGCFGRYVEWFRHRGQLHGFLRLAALVSGVTLAAGIAGALAGRRALAEFLFGDASYAPLAATCAVCIGPAAIFAFCNELLVALRRGRNAAQGHFLRGVLFTGLSLSMLVAWRCDASSLVTAYGLSFALASLFVGRCVRRALPDRFHVSPDRLEPIGTMLRLGPAIAGFWLADFLNNMFITVDRYMLVNLSGQGAQETLAAVGNYESAAVFPLLLTSLATMAARMVLPHQAKDWETGHTDRVCRSMNTALQTAGCVLILGSWFLVEIGPFLFSTAFHGQYPSGQKILPLVVTFSTWSALSSVMMNYFWCVEKTAWCAGAMLAGLLTNILLNIWLVPRWGLAGAAQATVVANAIQLAALFCLAERHGLRLSRRTWALALLPILLSWSPEAAGAAAVVSLLLALRAIKAS